MKKFNFTTYILIMMSSALLLAETHHCVKKQIGGLLQKVDCSTYMEGGKFKANVKYEKVKQDQDACVLQKGTGVSTSGKQAMPKIVCGPGNAYEINGIFFTLDPADGSKLKYLKQYDFNMDEIICADKPYGTIEDDHFELLKDFVRSDYFKNKYGEQMNVYSGTGHSRMSQVYDFVKSAMKNPLSEYEKYIKDIQRSYFSHPTSVPINMKDPSKSILKNAELVYCIYDRRRDLITKVVVFSEINPFKIIKREKPRINRSKSIKTLKQDK